MTSFMLKKSSYNFNCLFHGHRKQDSRGNCQVGALCAFLCYQNIPFTNLCWQPKVWGCIQFNRFLEALRIHQSGSSIQYLSMVLSAELEGGSILAEQLSHLMIPLILFKSLYKLVSKTVKRPQGVIMNKIHWKYIWTSQIINKYLFYMNKYLYTQVMWGQQKLTFHHFKNKLWPSIFLIHTKLSSFKTCYK